MWLFPCMQPFGFCLLFCVTMAWKLNWIPSLNRIRNCTRTVIWLPFTNLTCESSIRLQKLSRQLSTPINNTKFYCALWKRNFSIRFCFQNHAGLTRVWRRKSLSLLRMEMSHFWEQTWQKCRLCIAPNSLALWRKKGHYR